jgi:hypothetical protein
LHRNDASQRLPGRRAIAKAQVETTRRRRSIPSPRLKMLSLKAFDLTRATKVERVRDLLSLKTNCDVTPGEP